MTYFVTGATGFIGRHLLTHLLARKGDIHCLVRKSSLHRFEQLRERFGDDGKRLIAVQGDLAKPMLGVTPAQRKALSGKIKHFFHLAAIYDLAGNAESQTLANVEGTRHALELASEIKAGCFHHTSSIAAAGLYPGVFREDMFAEAENLEHPYFKTKHDSEGLVRKEYKRPYRIYRPGVVIGNSKTGERWLNAVNPCPGSFGYFLWEAAAQPMLFTPLITSLIDEAVEQHRVKQLPDDPTPEEARLFKRP
jgi:thioester reductase-like protein